MTRDNFLEHLRRKRAEASSVETTAETGSKTTAEMTDGELEAALTAARRELLDAQHEELRIREKARLVPGDAGRTKPRNLGGIFNKSKRRFK